MFDYDDAHARSHLRGVVMAPYYAHVLSVPVPTFYYVGVFRLFVYGAVVLIMQTSIEDFSGLAIFCPGRRCPGLPLVVHLCGHVCGYVLLLFAARGCSLRGCSHVNVVFLTLRVCECL